MRVFLENGKDSWTGTIVSARVGVLSNSFTPREFSESVGKNPVGVYLVKLDQGPPIKNIIGTVVFSK